MNWHQIFSSLSYWKNSQTIYDIHSPFLFDFIQYVFDANRAYYDFKLLKEIRKMMAADTGLLQISTVGAEGVPNGKKVGLPYLLKHVATPARISEQLYRINVYLQARNTLELGTCLGINSLYLAKSCENLYTIEGHAPFSNYARQLFRHTDADNIELKHGLFSEVLPQLQEKRFDLIYLDGHHEYKATKEYVENLYKMLSDEGILVLADIHWSTGMEKAWSEISAQEKFSLSMDCFYYGLLWKKAFKGPKQHFVFLPKAWLKPWKFLKAI
jgi:predicted O-methyltransferase YrrM